MRSCAVPNLPASLPPQRFRFFPQVHLGHLEERHPAEHLAIEGVFLFLLVHVLDPLAVLQAPIVLECVLGLLHAIVLDRQHILHNSETSGLVFNGLCDIRYFVMRCGQGREYNSRMKVILPKDVEGDIKGAKQAKQCVSILVLCLVNGAEIEIQEE